MDNGGQPPPPGSRSPFQPGLGLGPANPYGPAFGPGMEQAYGARPAEYHMQPQPAWGHSGTPPPPGMSYPAGYGWDPMSAFTASACARLASLTPAVQAAGCFQIYGLEVIG